MKLFTKTYDEFVNEEVLGDLKVKNQLVTFYKNPKSIKRMSHWKRAVSDKDGNLFVADDKDTMLHSYIVNWLHKTGNVKHFSKDLRNLMKWYIMWHQVGKSNIFCLSESYRTMSADGKDYLLKGSDEPLGTAYYDIRHFQPFIESSLKKLRRKNPQFEFVLERIWTYAEEILPYESGKYRLLKAEID